MASTLCYSVPASTEARPAPGPTWRAWLKALELGLARAFDAYLDWRGRRLSRRQLLELDDRLLRDIGLDRAAAEAAANTPWWTFGR